jgi:hypothetical protein
MYVVVFEVMYMWFLCILQTNSSAKTHDPYCTSNEMPYASAAKLSIMMLHGRVLCTYNTFQLLEVFRRDLKIERGQGNEERIKGLDIKRNCR